MAASVTTLAPDTPETSILLGVSSKEYAIHLVALLALWAKARAGIWNKQHNYYLLHDLKVLDAGPVLFTGRAQQPKDLVQLCNLALLVEEHLLCQELRHDASQGPHIDGSRVLLAACTWH